MPNLRQLEYLVAIADTFHFGRAAERTNTTQPTLSEQLKALEQRLGAQLVERSRSKVLLTPIGEQIVEIARRMLADANEIRSLAASGGKELAGILRLGLPPTIGPFFLPVAIPALQDAYPNLQLYVREDLPSNLPGALAEGRHDLILSPLPIKRSDLVAQPLFREPLYLTVSRKHPLASKKSVSRKQLSEEDILALGPGHQLHDAVLALCEDLGARPKLEYEGTSLDTLREMVAMDLGVTFLPGLYVRSVAAGDPNVVTLPLKDRSLSRTIGLIWRRTTSRGDNYASLAELFREQITAHFPECVVLT